MKPKNEEKKYWLDEDYRVRLAKILCVFALFAIAIIGLLWMVITPVSLTGYLDCTTGDVDLKASFHNEVQNKSCEKTSLIDGEYKSIKTNETCFTQEWVGERIDFAGIENLRCRVNYKLKAPFLLTLTLLN